jgi:hypothetical protein
MIIAYEGLPENGYDTREVLVKINHEEDKQELLRWKDENASINDPTLGPTREQGQNDGIPAATKGGISWRL